MSLSIRYRALLPTLDLGRTALWERSLNCQLRLDEDGLTLRHNRKVPWNSICKIGVSRNYLDGHVSEVRIHHSGGINKISIRGLRDSETVVRDMLTIFERTRRSRAVTDRPIMDPSPNINSVAGANHSVADMSELGNQMMKPLGPIATAA
jgi:hypothetical protein